MATAKSQPVLRHPSQIILWECDWNIAPRGPVCVRCLGLQLTNQRNCFGGFNSRMSASNRVRNQLIAKLIANELFLSGQLTGNQFSNDPQSDSRLIRESLSAMQSSIR